MIAKRIAQRLELDKTNRWSEKGVIKTDRGYYSPGNKMNWFFTPDISRAIKVTFEEAQDLGEKMFTEGQIPSIDAYEFILSYP